MLLNNTIPLPTLKKLPSQPLVLRICYIPDRSLCKSSWRVRPKEKCYSRSLKSITKVVYVVLFVFGTLAHESKFFLT